MKWGEEELAVVVVAVAVLVYTDPSGEGADRDKINGSDGECRRQQEIQSMANK